MLTAAAGLSTLLFVFAGAAVGLRLTALAWRTRELAETLLGPGLFMVVGVGYPLLIVGRHLTEQGASSGPLMLWSALIAMSFGWSLVWMFTWRVFRPHAAWARALAWGACLAFAACLAESLNHLLSVDRPQDVLIPSPGALGNQLNAMALFGWTAFESFRYYGLLRKRLALGLASPVVANRVLLWGLVSVFSLVSLTGPLVAGLMRLDFMANPAVLLSVASGGSMAAVALYLAFLPPKAYLKMIEDRAPKPS